MQRPKIYISSTIYDFRDLRSALKYWLEQFGYEVMLSEFNDFTKPLDENSYIACLRAVEQCNFFILLIGTRIGGYYEKSQKISITRMEYRTAYELANTGKMQIVTFVRSDLWNVKEDRKALREFLIEDFKIRKELDDDDIAEIVQHPSSIVNDARAIFDFLNEVGRVAEMKQAMDGKGDFPKANWVHQFSTFEEVVKALQIVFDAKRNLGTVALMVNLKRELITNLVELLEKDKKNNIRLHTFYADFAREHLKGGTDDASTMPSRYIKWLVMYLIAKASGDKLSTQFIDQALITGEFLEYDFNSNSYKIGLLHQALFSLKQNIVRLRSLGEGTLGDRIGAFLDKYMPRNNPIIKATAKDITIPNEELTIPLAYYDCERNVTELCVGIFKALNDDFSRISDLKLRASSPIEEMAEGIEQETPTIEDVMKWLGEQ
jgi:hypothetical protein